MSEYFVEIQGEHKRHSFRVEANFTPGRDFVSNPYNEEEFLRPAEPDEVDIISVYLESENGEKEIENPSEALTEMLIEKIIEEERNGI